MALNKLQGSGTLALMNISRKRGFQSVLMNMLCMLRGIRRKKLCMLVYMLVI